MTALAAALVGLAAWLAHRPALTPGAPPARESSAAEVALLARWRPALALLAGVAGWSFVSGALAPVAAVAAAMTAWRVLGRVESPETARRRARVEADLPVIVDLAASGLESGLAVTEALGSAAAAFPGPAADELLPWLHRLRLGADPSRVWAEVAEHPALAPLGRALGRAHDSGASVAAAARRLAEDLRRSRTAAWEARARAVSIRAAAPMGACFLPAFLLLGIVPLVASLLGSLSIG
ncbi:type II secretion system F family protein [Alteromonas gracilis]